MDLTTLNRLEKVNHSKGVCAKSIGKSTDFEIVLKSTFPG